MGNQTPNFIPMVLAKNWAPVPNYPNKFHNKLTFDYARKHIICITSAQQLKSFKDRLKQSNQLICRVLFYQQYHDNIYHIYTDDNTLQPIAIRQWKQIKIKIVKAFLELVHIYGLMRVCKQMIGADANGNIKIWIHPDSVINEPFSKTKSETLMLTDILNIFKEFEDKWNINGTGSLKYQLHPQQLTFNQYLSRQMARLPSQPSNISKTNKTEQGPSSQQTNIFFPFPYLTDNQNINSNRNPSPNTNLYLNINIQVQNKNKNNNDDANNKHQQNQKENSKGNSLGKNTDPQKIKYDNAFSIQTKNTNIMRNPFDSTSRGQKRSPIIISSARERRIATNPKSLSLTKEQRPLTFYHNIKRTNQNNERIKQSSSDSPTRRRDTLNFKLALNSHLKNSSIQHLVKLKNKVILNKKVDQQKNVNDPQRLKTNNPQTLPQLLNNYVPKSHSGTKNQHKNMSLNLNLNELDSHQKQANFLQKQSSQKSEKKQTNLPYFLNIKTNTQTHAEIMRINSQTQRTNRIKTFQQERNVYEPQKNELPLLEGLNANPFEQTEKENSTVLKQQLQNILSTQIQPPQRPISIDYEVFKASKILYRGKSYEPYETESDQDQINSIKEKVEEKKARFAQLKLDARKILEDSL